MGLYKVWSKLRWNRDGLWPEHRYETPRWLERSVLSNEEGTWGHATFPRDPKNLSGHLYQFSLSDKYLDQKIPDVIVGYANEKGVWIKNDSVLQIKITK